MTQGFSSYENALESPKTLGKARVGPLDKKQGVIYSTNSLSYRGKGSNANDSHLHKIQV